MTQQNSLYIGLTRACNTLVAAFQDMVVPSVSSVTDTSQLQLEGPVFLPWMSALVPPDLEPMQARNLREAPVIIYSAEVVGPHLAERAAKHGLTIEIWLRAGGSVYARAAFDRKANAALKHVYGREYLMHDRLGGCHFIVILRNAQGVPVASSIYVFCICDTLRGFRGWMEQVRKPWRTPDTERLLFEIGHSAVKFLALCDPFVAPHFAGMPFATVETALSTIGYRVEDELMLRSVGYSLHCEREWADDPCYTYHKQVRLSKRD